MIESQKASATSALAGKATTRAPTVSTQVLRALVEGVEQVGVPRAAVLKAIGIDAGLLHDATTRVSRDAVDHMCELAIELTGDPSLGLHWAMRISLGAMGPLNHMLAHAGTFRQCVELARRFGPLLADEPSYQLSEDADEATIRMVAMEDRTPAVRRFLAEMVLGCFTRLLDHFCPRARIERACFAYPEPANRAEYANTFGEAVQFDAPFTGIMMERGLLDRPSELRDEDVLVALRDVMERRIDRVAKPSYALRTRDFLRARAPARVNMKTVARSLGLSARSLRRHLSAEGASFHQVEHEARAQVAVQLLQEPRTIEGVAFEMGFSDAATFHRAFKRWTGRTPSEVRSGRRGRAP